VHRSSALLRTLLTIVGLSVAVSAVVALVGISGGIEKSFLNLYSDRGADIVVTRRGGTQTVNNTLSEDLEDKIRVIPGVKHVVGGLLDSINFPEANLPNVILNGWSADCPLWEKLEYVAGRKLTAADQEGVVVGKLLASGLGKSVGEYIGISGSEFKILGIATSSSVFENKACFMLRPVMQKLLGPPGKVTGFSVGTMKPGDQKFAAEICEKIIALSPNEIDAKTTNDFVATLPQLRVVRGVTWITSAIAIFIGAIGVLNTMVMSVFERTKEIGTLRAIGWRKARVVRMVMVEALLLSLAGAILGTISALILAKFFSSFRQTSGFVEGTIAPSVIVQGFIIAIIVGVLGAAYPAWWGASLPPTEALRKK